MELRKHDLMEVTTSAAIATDDTVVFTYPTTSPARAAASYLATSGAVLAAAGLQAVLEQGASTFTLSYSTSTVTLTYKGDTTIPAGTKLTLQAPLVEYEDLTDNSGGTASNTLADITEAANAGSADRAPVENAIASLAAKINDILATLRAHGIVPPAN